MLFKPKSVKIEKVKETVKKRKKYSDENLKYASHFVILDTYKSYLKKRKITYDKNIFFSCSWKNCPT